ncbi:MAG: PP0621 family protein [Gallionellaceae bacterium]|nr:PP0621 family protein [Gallionellaceae bacterium]
MSRLLFLIVIFALIYLLLKSYLKQVRKNDKSEQTGSVPTEDMVCCAHCGVHLPKHESMVTDDMYFCSEAHRRAHADKHQ